MTYQDQFDSAMKCQTKEEADKWLAAEIERCQLQTKLTLSRTKEIILSNLGYIAGYYNYETSMKVYNLFGAKHPVFGHPDYWKNLSSEDCYKIGLNLGKNIFKNSSDIEGGFEPFVKRQIYHRKLMAKYCLFLGYVHVYYADLYISDGNFGFKLWLNLALMCLAFVLSIVELKLVAKWERLLWGILKSKIIQAVYDYQEELNKCEKSQLSSPTEK